jgi:hypothetical protein
VRRGGIVVAVLGLVTIASCSSGGGVLGGSTPGHATPKAAVAGYLSGLAGGGSGLCSYVDPSDQADCASELAQVHTGITGSYAIGNDVVQGTEALVTLTGSVCISFSAASTETSSCAHNSNSSTGLPTSSGAFEQAYATAQQGNADSSTIPCIEIDGSWYVSESFSDNSGTTPTTLTPATSPAITTPTVGGETTLPTTPETTTPATTTPVTPTTCVSESGVTCSPTTTTPTTFSLGG